MKKQIQFASLHCHNYYSIRDSQLSPENMVARAKELNYYALAETNHGKMYDSYHFYQLCKDNGIKPIIGVEAYIRKLINGKNKNFHLIILAKNYEGYKELCASTRISEKNTWRGKPTLTHEDLQTFFPNGNVVISSACMGGEIPYYILQNDYESARETALWYKDMFGDDFFLEYQNHYIPEQKIVIQGIRKLSKELSIKTIITADSHFAKPEDLFYHDMMVCNGHGKTKSTYTSVYTKHHCMKSIEDLYEDFKGLMPEEEISEAFKNTCDISDKCNIEFPKNANHYPKYPDLKEGETADELLRKRAIKGLDKYVPLYKRGDKETKTKYLELLDKELDVIKKTGFPDYFLNVSEILTAYNNKGYYTGPGRGSAAGSLVANAMNITKVDPLQYGLFFDRFLNLERVSPPDIDSDFDGNREYAFEYTTEKYGVEKTCKIITFGTLGGRNAIRMVCRVQEYPLYFADKIAKAFSSKPGAKFKDVLDQESEFFEQEFYNMYNTDPEVKKVIDIAMHFEGVVDHTGIHAAACIIGDDNLTNYIPLQWDDKTQYWVSQYYKQYNEDLGLLKMDYLGLNNLSIFKETLNLIKKRHNITMTHEELIDNSLQQSSLLVREIYATGKTYNVFQFESEGITEMLKKFKPTTKEDLIILNALYRPGPMQFIDEIIENKKNPQNIRYDIPDLKPILDETYGCPVYQEQIMSIFRTVCGYSLGQADIIRRAMSKKKMKDLIAAKEDFCNGYVRLGSTREKADQYFEKLMDFASYAFNKSHATAYVTVSLESAYLKYFYPLEYMTACLSCIPSPDKYQKQLEICKKMGFKILPPDINKSDELFNAEGNDGIRFGLSCIKNIGKSAAEIIGARPYKSFADFISKTDKIPTLNSGKFESLALAGAFDNLGVNRMTAYKSSCLLAENKKHVKKITQNQVDFFSLGMIDNEDVIDVKYYEELPYITKLDKEYELLFTYVTGHPLEQYRKHIEKYSEKSFIDITPEDNGNVIKVIARAKEVKLLFKKENNKPMKKVILEDLTADIPCMMFTKAYEQYGLKLNDGDVKLIELKVNVESDSDEDTGEERYSISGFIQSVKDLQPLDKVIVKVSNRKQIEENIEVLNSNSGIDQVSFFIKNERRVVKYNKLVEINSKIYSTFGKENTTK